MWALEQLEQQLKDMKLQYEELQSSMEAKVGMTCGKIWRKKDYFTGIESPLRYFLILYNVKLILQASIFLELEHIATGTKWRQLIYLSVADSGGVERCPYRINEIEAATGCITQ